MSQLKRLYILRSVAGAGKTTVAEHLKAVYEQIGQSVVIAEANDYFMKNGVYEFDHALLEEAHTSCKDKVVQAMEDSCNVIFVTNTSTRVWEFEMYLKLGEEFGYHTTVMVVENYHGGKTNHGVEEHTLAKQRKRFDITL